MDQMNDIMAKLVNKKHNKSKLKISLTLAKKIIRRAKIKIQEGHSYLIYECGHVYDYVDDTAYIVYNAGLRRAARCCPVCVSKALITKYKKCSCGAEHVGKRVQSSICCAACSSVRRAAKGEVTLNQLKRNSHLADSSRYMCIHRKQCLDLYCVYDTIPCKGCKRYQCSVY